jgi:hypothetical protein
VFPPYQRGAGGLWGVRGLLGKEKVGKKSLVIASLKKDSIFPSLKMAISLQYTANQQLLFS